MRNYWKYLLILLLATSCQGEKKDVVNLNDILPQSERYGDERQDEVIEEVDSSALLLKRFEDHGIEISKVEELSGSLFPERFGPESNEKFTFKTDQNTFKYYRWNFEDSSKVMNAFFNWIDCFGENCKSAFVGQEKNFQKNSFRLFVNTASMVFVESEENNFDTESWIEFLEKEGFEEDWTFVLTQRKRGRVKWYQMIDGKKVKYETK